MEWHGSFGSLENDLREHDRQTGGKELCDRMNEINPAQGIRKKHFFCSCECVSYNLTLILHFIILKANYCCSSSLTLMIRVLWLVSTYVN